MKPNKLVEKLGKYDKIYIDKQKYPIKNGKRRTIQFQIGTDDEYHEKAMKKSCTVLLPKENRQKYILKKSILHLPTIKYKEYSEMKKHFQLPECSTLLKDGRANSNSIKNYYTPHIHFKKNIHHFKKLFKPIEQTLNYYYQ